ncbi:phosphoenolpyruvate carboxykinase (ATP) [Algoriphagus sanaruensis]|uniref:Phosphoenolpyruvate carboxykinase (ATP) n=1 Tax=Algoriphagus sanaruensis TaxID=1727163 RepID=A0A142EPH4_9BACT|nr:phosphoenolpyruvate carboxykinase (ATP) [Algoriphagus sanaruensis]AMQ57029.1 phosphoenolpyruvate carboxykinase [Algoriphagus sanaruensis]
MQDLVLESIQSPLSFLNFEAKEKVYYNLSPAELVEHSLARKEGVLTSTGALMADTGKFTGRSPKDRYIVFDETTKDSVWWGDINIPFDEEKFDALFSKMKYFLEYHEVYVRDVFAGADPRHRLSIRVLNTLAWHNLFCHNMFIQPDKAELTEFTPDFTIICVPQFEASPELDGTRNGNFSIINLSKRIILIGGTGYAGEMKKGIFSALNFILPFQKNVLSMHCSANVGEDGDSAIFFGLSGTGKTTLSADPKRKLIGDDEHGWDGDSLFNFEGGCYAKVIDLSEEKEPEIFRAIKFGAIVENTRFFPGTREINFQDAQVTENTRTAYPLSHIPTSVIPSVTQAPKNIFFLTADAFGVIPPISKLNKSQTMYHFISGYTAKVAGTEMGISEPKLTFSACFGAAFLPLHPTAYAKLFGEKMEYNDVNVWLVNTGWTGGPYGIGNRMKLSYTRAMISAALEGKLDYAPYRKDEFFGFAVPKICPGVPSDILDPKKTWKDQDAYDFQAKELAQAFKINFEKFKDFADEELLMGGPL